MKKLLPTLTMLFSFALLTGCMTKPQGPVSLPTAFEDMWYRPTLTRPGIKVMVDTGRVSVNESEVLFSGGETADQIDIEDILELSYRSVGTDVINQWVIVKYREGSGQAHALFTGGAMLGWGGSGDSARLFEAISIALNKKGMSSVIMH